MTDSTKTLTFNGCPIVWDDPSEPQMMVVPDPRRLPRELLNVLVFFAGAEAVAEVWRQYEVRDFIKTLAALESR